MKTYKLALAATFALMLLTLPTMLLAAPNEPGKELKQELGNAPIRPRPVLKAHSDAWSDFYFNRNVATELPFYFESASRGPLRGGLAGLHAAAKPIARKTDWKAHSDEWNARYFDRNVNQTLSAPASEYLDPGLRRGGLAK